MRNYIHTFLYIVIGFVFAGCSLSKQVGNEVSILSRDKYPADNDKEGKVASVKDEFIKNIKKKGSTSNQISRDDCDAITTKTQFRYSSSDDSSILVYPIDNLLVQIHHLDSGKCAVLGSIDLEKEVSEFTYLANGDPLTKQVSSWSLEQIEGCGGDFEYIPGCKTLAKYKKVSFVGDQEKADEGVKRYEFSDHHREPSASWLMGRCQLVQGDDEFNCKKYNSLVQVKKYREYIVNGSSASFGVYLSNSEVFLE